MRKLGDLVWDRGRHGRVGPGDASATSGSSRASGGRTQRTIARLEDDTGSIDATWFGRRFIERRLRGRRRGRRVRQGQALRPAADARQPGVPGRRRTTTELLHAGRIVPVYPLTAGLTAIRLRAAIREALDKAGHAYPEYLPADIAAAEGLVPIAARDRGGPLPGHRSRVATRRCAGSPSTSCWRSSSGWSSAAGSGSAPRRPRSRSTTRRDAAVRAAIVDALGGPGRPAGRADRRPGARDDAIRDDLARPTPMLRLLQGDVGSGKTAVAAYALAATARAGLQGALLAPTDLLARQHLETVGALLEGVGHRRHAADRVAQGRRQGQGARGDRVGPGAGRRRHPRAHPGRRSPSPISASWSSTSSTASGSTSAARSRRRPAAGRRTSC